LRVEALDRITARGAIRHQGDRFLLPADIARRLARLDHPLVRLLPSDDLRAVKDANTWTRFSGRELRATPDIAAHWYVVACVSIWNDLPALKATLPSWLPHVDRAVVADGSWGTVERGPCTEGLKEYVAKAEREPGQFIILDCAWSSQLEKRTTLLREAGTLSPGADRPVLCLIIDADEVLTAGAALRRLPRCDVGWLEIQNDTLYRRTYGQPRCVAARLDLAYRGRHHWLYAGDRLLATHQYAGRGWRHAWCEARIENRRMLGRGAARIRAKAAVATAQYQQETPAVAEPGRTEMSDRSLGGRESLRVLQLAPYDPGLVAFRLHTGLNVTTPHSSAFVRRTHDNPFAGPVQFDHGYDEALVAQLAQAADVAHCHLDYGMLSVIPRDRRPRWTVIHHHGTILRRMSGYFNVADQQAQLRLISNWDLTRYGDGRHYLPNPVPVAEYQALRTRAYRPHPGRILVGHSPSKPEIKGTADFLAVCERLRARGVPVEPLVTVKMPHAQALQAKARCDLFFDSFDLGIQCSGLEAAAMGIPVLAGDEYVYDRFRRWLGPEADAPYRLVRTPADLEEALAHYAQDDTARAEAGARALRYVTAYHDEAAVALRYLDLLDAAVHWRTVLRIGGRG